ncbi:MAG: transposase [Spirochaetes bacterium]|nr:transposase [Spirochaetota bacterium]
MRKRRILEDGALYHVTARANRKEMILDTVLMKDLFLDVVKRAKAKYNFRVENFCIMGNHFHLMLRPAKGESLSSIMQWILSVFAMAYNRMKKLTGHVWGCRFFSRIVACLLEFLEIYAYIDENPVKANQVGNPRDWRHGGLWHDRTGLRDVIDGAAAFVRMVFPEHGQLLLGER